jgi:hypothetical protein
MSDAATGTNSVTEGIITCPYCGDTVSQLVAIESGMKLRLNREAQLESVPDEVCDGCLKILNKMISKGAALRFEVQAKEQNRLMLWRNRVQLVKQAKVHLSKKNFSDAAVAYEKYLRVLEIVYETKPGELSPDLFKNQARAQEMTVITSVYWDLMRIYDTHATYRERQYKAAQKLAEFVRFTPVFPHIIRKAESQTRQAKNPEAFQKFLKLSNANRPRCFIATAAFDGYGHPTIWQLCRFRDQFLRHSGWGRIAIYHYYRCSPGIAAFLDRNPALKPFVRAALTQIAKCKFVRKRLNDWAALVIL